MSTALVPRNSSMSSDFRNSVVGVVLAGGTSRRFGGVPKGLELVDGSRIIDRVADAVRSVSSELLLAANDPNASGWLPGVAVVQDIHPRGGGLSGVEAALARGRDIVVVAWDMPFVTPDLLRLLLSASHGARVTVPESNSAYGVEPFCAWYSTAVLPELSAFLDQGGGPARDFLSGVPGVHRVPLDEVARIGTPERLLLSVNTAEDLDRARALARSQ